MALALDSLPRRESTAASSCADVHSGRVVFRYCGFDNRNQRYSAEARPISLSWKRPNHAAGGFLDYQLSNTRSSGFAYLARNSSLSMAEWLGLCAAPSSQPPPLPRVPASRSCPSGQGIDLLADYLGRTFRCLVLVSRASHCRTFDPDDDSRRFPSPRHSPASHRLVLSTPEASWCRPPPG